jgi:pimeloyl-ACP methyl ester carboxylesterase
MTWYLRSSPASVILSFGARLQPAEDAYSILPKAILQLRHQQTRTLTQSYLSPRPKSTIMPQTDAQTLILPDGRTLGYAEYGSPNGTPLLYFHGFPSSRLEAYSLHSIASRLNIRVLSLDRPGFGLSTHDPHRRIIDWPADVQAFASQIGLSRFAVLGVSGGGPYSLECAEQLPRDKLSAVGVLAGGPVWDRGFRTKGVPWYARLTYLLGNYWPSGLRILSYALVGALRWIMRTGPVERRIDGWLESTTKAKAAREKKEKENDGNVDLEKESLIGTTSAEEADKQQEVVRSTAQRRESLMGLLFEGFAQGTSGFVHETRLLTGDWGFKFEDVTFNKVQMWHGSKDANAPVRSIRNMAERMPHCVLKEYNDNHFSMGNHVDEILEELIAEARR